MNSVKIKVKTGSIGPDHDPYATCQMTVSQLEKAAVWYEDGLGLEYVELYQWDEEKLEEVLVRRIEWNNGRSSNEHRNKGALAAILFRRHIGISIPDAYDQWEHEQRMRDRDDPFGGRDPYYGGA